MPGKAKTGKRRTHSGAKKRVHITSTGKAQVQKAAHNHRLDPKNTRQKNLGGTRLTIEGKQGKTLIRMATS